MDKFTQAYIEAAFFSSTDESTPSGGEPLDRNYSIDDLAPETLIRIEADCARFQADNEIPEYSKAGYSNEEFAGHDFWLTRNGHGAGFWDGDLPKDVGEKLTAAAHAFGEFYLYVGDDGRIHGC